MIIICETPLEHSPGWFLHPESQILWEKESGKFFALDAATGQRYEMREGFNDNSQMTTKSVRRGFSKVSGLGKVAAMFR